MRIIDSDAINKRVFSDISNTFQHSKKITGENTVQNLSGQNSTHSLVGDNVNWNGLEFSFFKQQLNFLSTALKEFKVERNLIEISNNEAQVEEYNTIQTVETDSNGTESIKKTNISNDINKGMVIKNSKHKIAVPSGFDGRNSFLIVTPIIVARIPKPITIKPGFSYFAHIVEKSSLAPSYSKVDNIFSLTNNDFYTFRLSTLKAMKLGLSEKMLMLDGDEYLNAWAGIVGNLSSTNELIIDKQKDILNITCSLTLTNKNGGIDRNGGDTIHELGSKNAASANMWLLARGHWIHRVYLDFIALYWRDI